MRRYTIKLPDYERPFPYITDVSPDEVADAIWERFGVYPVSVTAG